MRRANHFNVCVFFFFVKLEKNLIAFSPSKCLGAQVVEPQGHLPLLAGVTSCQSSLSWHTRQRELEQELEGEPKQGLEGGPKQGLKEGGPKQELKDESKEGGPKQELEE